MDAEIVNILKAKCDAVEALEFALAEQVKAGTVASGESALRFVKTWAEAMQAMVPALTTVTAPPKTMFSANSSDATHYREDFSGPLTACGRDVQDAINLLYTDDAADVTCLACADSLS